MSGQASLRSRILIAGGQVALIVLSVLLAFVLNEWRQRAAHDELGAQALAGLRTEFETNRDRASESADYRATLIEEVRVGNARLQLRPAFIASNAWESAQAADALRHLPYRIVEVAGEIHELQEIYRDIAVTGGDLLYLSNMLSNDVLGAGQQTFVPVLEDMVYFERQLVRLYDDALILIDSLEATR